MLQGVYYKVLGYGIVDNRVLCEIDNLLCHPEVMKLRKKKEVLSEKPNDVLFREGVLEVSMIRSRWASAVAYALLLNMDLNTARYVDKTREKSNMDSYKMSRDSAIRAFVEHYLG